MAGFVFLPGVFTFREILTGTNKSNLHDAFKYQSAIIQRITNIKVY